MDPTIFREYDIRGSVGEQLNDETIPQIARAIGTFFRGHGAIDVALGWDCRKSSPSFADLVSTALRETGCNVLSIGEVSTPMLYHTAATKPVDAGVMITGSHNPLDQNGFKMCLRNASLFGTQIREISSIAEKKEFGSGAGEISSIEVHGDYCKDLLDRLNRLERKLKVVVDAGNGMGGIAAVPIYQAMGAEVVELFTDPDGTFPNHHPDPTVPANLVPLIEKVSSTHADLGIAFDGDGDRIGVVTPNGRIVWGDELMILFSRSILARMTRAKIIGDVKCSQALFDDVKENGGEPIMWKTGHSLIKAKMRETGAVLAGEMSGHIFFADRFHGFDDAAYAGGRLLELLASSGRSLLEELQNLPAMTVTPEIRVDCADERKFELVREITRWFEQGHDVITVDGARINFEHGWGLVRASNTQPIIVLRFEADTTEHLAEIRDEVESVVTDHLRSTSYAVATSTV
jgi:phosphomannomutase / phosphoglucomutase